MGIADSYTDQECVDMLQIAAAIFGSSVTMDEYDSLGVMPNSERLRDKYGSWNGAREAAGLERNPPNRQPDEFPSVYTELPGGYEQLYCRGDTSLHHRLLATLLVDNIEELRGKHVHHNNEIPWDNRLGNLTIMTPGEHNKEHNKPEKMAKGYRKWRQEEDQ